MNIKRINKKLQKSFGGKFTAVSENGAIRALKDYFDPDYLMNPGGTIGLDLKPEEKKFLREHREYDQE